MTHPRYRRLMTRLSVLAVLAMLWAQCVLLVHPVSWALTAVSAAAAPVVVTASGCHEAAVPQAEASVCAAHCAQGEHSADTARIPPVPPLLPGVLPVLPHTASAAAGIQRAVPAATWPTVSWHRPTPHPASLLLI